jgi:bifunctional DNA-binding transcriptional regulator/antitoxin component of YhaV-PrlF toxin-antitoxin module
MKEGDILVEIDGDGRIILKRTEDVEYIHVIKNRGQWQDLVKAVINIRASQNTGNLTSCATVILS